MMVCTHSSLMAHVQCMKTYRYDNISHAHIQATELPLTLCLHFMTIPYEPSPSIPKFSYFSMTSCGDAESTKVKKWMKENLGTPRVFFLNGDYYSTPAYSLEGAMYNVVY